MKILSIMSSKLELLEQCITELGAENDENAKLKSRVGKLEARIAIVEHLGNKMIILLTTKRFA
jgi:hypothetical protein